MKTGKEHSGTAPAIRRRPSRIPVESIKQRGDGRLSPADLWQRAQSDRYSSLLHLRRRMWQYRHFYVLALPAIVLLILANYIPMGGLVIAFKRYSVNGGMFGMSSSL